jgi:Ni,Fe-hydrogenase I small subunit
LSDLHDGGAAVGMSATTVSQIVEAAARGLKPSVVWLHFQECTGCTGIAAPHVPPRHREVILDLIPSTITRRCSRVGPPAEARCKDTIKKNAGKFICVVEAPSRRRTAGSTARSAGAPRSTS